MDKSIDWSEWILQKNSEAKQEELKKSDFVLVKTFSTDWEESPEDTSIPEGRYGKKRVKPISPGLALLADKNPHIFRSLTSEWPQDDESIKGFTSGGFVHYEKIPEEHILDDEHIKANPHISKIIDDPMLEHDYRRHHLTGKIYKKIMSGPLTGKYFSANLNTGKELQDLAAEPKNKFD